MNIEDKKPIHAKPSLYAFYFEVLKEIALKYGYNLVLHGSMKRDLDLVAIPWQENIGSHDEMIEEFITHLGGDLQYANGVPRSLALKYNEKIDSSWLKYNITHHGRMHYIININRECKTVDNVRVDPQYYIDISIIPSSSEAKQKEIITKIRTIIRETWRSTDTVCEINQYLTELENLSK